MQTIGYEKCAIGVTTAFNRLISIGLQSGNCVKVYALVAVSVRQALLLIHWLTRAQKKSEMTWVIACF